MAEALALCEAAAPPELAVLDINLRDGSSGVDVARALLERWPEGKGGAPPPRRATPACRGVGAFEIEQKAFGAAVWPISAADT